ncbi:MAG: SDR family oxidoreductase [Pseudomonadota bacterium]
MHIDLRGKSALITGGSRGIGRAVALRLAGCGANVVICGRTRASLDATITALREHGVEAHGIIADVSVPDEITALVEEAHAHTGGPDILINNAVTSTSARFDELSDDAFRYHIDVKLMAYIRVARLVLPHMAARGGGRIVNIGGMTARIVAPLRMTNGVVNAGVANFTKQFAGYAARHQVTVNCVHPGYTATERVEQIFDAEAERTGQTRDAIIAERTAEIPLGRLVQPDDLAHTVAYFCSTAAGMVTGQCLAVDGGSGQAIAY